MSELTSQVISLGGPFAALGLGLSFILLLLRKQVLESELLKEKTRSLIVDRLTGPTSFDPKKALWVYAFALDRLLQFSVIRIKRATLRTPSLGRTVLFSLLTVTICGLVLPLSLKYVWLLPARALALYLLCNIAADFVNLTLSRSIVVGMEAVTYGKILLRIALCGALYIFVLFLAFCVVTTGFLLRPEVALEEDELQEVQVAMSAGVTGATAITLLALSAPFWGKDFPERWSEWASRDDVLEDAPFTPAELQGVTILVAAAVTWASVLVYAGLMSLLWPVFAWLAYSVGWVVSYTANIHNWLLGYLDVRRDPMGYLRLWSCFLWVSGWAVYMVIKFALNRV